MNALLAGEEELRGRCWVGEDLVRRRVVEETENVGVRCWRVMAMREPQPRNVWSCATGLPAGPSQNWVPSGLFAPAAASLYSYASYKTAGRCCPPWDAAVSAAMQSAASVLGASHL